MRQPQFFFILFFKVFFLAAETKLRKSRLASSPMADSQIYFIFMIVSITNNHARFAVFRINSHDMGHGCFLNKFDRLEVGLWVGLNS